MLFSCSVEQEQQSSAGKPDAEDTDAGYFLLELQGVKATRATTTSISKEEADNFLITIFKGDAIVRESTPLRDVNTRLSAGYGYSIKAESCSEATAEASNSGWGQRRYAGHSAQFAIKAGETTKVGVGCSVVNAGVCVVFDETLSSYFTTDYRVTIKEGDRTLLFTSANAGSSIGEEATDGQIAYFNTGADDTRTISYTIHAEGPKTIDKTYEITLSTAKISRLKLTYDTSTFNVSISVDETDVYIDDSITIRPEDIVGDDGSTEITADHDAFSNSGEAIDINNYGQSN